MTSPDTPVPGGPGRDATLQALFAERRTLINLCYRMLGTLQDAEDAVQETYARWYSLPDDEQQAVRSPLAWLTRVAGRICLDQLTSARARRERYVGEWLPEPVRDSSVWSSTGGSHGGSQDPVDRVTLDESISMGLLVVLETMTPAERVAFVLHDVFGMPFDDIADTVGRTPAACRQLASSARRRLRAARPDTDPVDRHRRVVSAFREACETGDFDTLVTLLDPMAQSHSDGGGKVRAALRPVTGRDKVARLVSGLLRKDPGLAFSEETVNGRPGLAVRAESGTTIAVIAIDVAGGLITSLWMTVNPDKLHTWNGDLTAKEASTTG
ncbi:RNA polymerase sigma factor SigJ [Streptomyces sp. TRM49041]|uniref:RNA polymerase sigma factor SigJ n=1 Tax=Streptomyces sp. TRM49041 TaxID=2603216 RepID=UPI0021CCD14B|nr:RNA polymerase sigma factor SigJ [Streptomyces sp. TRM49041]